jgi:hypothetical protein
MQAIFELNLQNYRSSVDGDALEVPLPMRIPADYWHLRTLTGYATNDEMQAILEMDLSADCTLTELLARIRASMA